LLSLSKTIEASKSAYYEALEKAQTFPDVTGWLRYFVGMAAEAQSAAEKQVEFVLLKTRLFDLHRDRL